MPIRTILYSGAASALVLMASAPVSAQASDDISVDLLQLLVDEGVVPRERAQQLLDRARQAAEERSKKTAPKDEGVIDVPYVPEALRAQIKDEVKQEVMAEAKTQGWVAPNTLPDWTNRIAFSGDMRFRYEWQNFSEGNFPFFPDVGAINLKGGVTDAQGFPLLNSTVDRHRQLYRARLDIKARISDHVQAGIRLASGNERGAVSTNSTLGDFFLKDNFWLDRAYVSLTPVKGATLSAGRIANPFVSTDMVWDPDINPEGVALKLSRPIDSTAELFGTAGYFPLEERSLYGDTYMLGGQLGIRTKVNDNLSATVAAAYYDYRGIQSQKNAPDGSRLLDYTAPRFLDKGNSVFNMRTDGLTTLAGLASDFNLLTGHINVAYDRGPLRFSLTGEAVRNLALDPAEVARLRGEPGVAPGDFGWQVRFDAGHREINKFGDWYFGAAYKRIETDAVLDIFTDSDFGLGGTDVKGYLLEAGLGIYRNTSLGLSWFSTNTINRPPFAIDVLQVNLQTRF